MNQRIYLFAWLTLASCVAVPAYADSVGSRCGQDDLQTSYARRMSCEQSVAGSATSSPQDSLTMPSEQPALIAMDIIGNSGETTPEPSSLILLGGGLLGAFATMRRGLSR